MKAPKSLLSSLFDKSSRPVFLASSAFAFLLAFSIVSLYQVPAGSYGSFFASIAQVKSSVNYPADLIMSHSNEGLEFVFGAQANSVDQIEWMIFVSPDAKFSFGEDLSENLTLSSLGDGAYRFIISWLDVDIRPGSKIWFIPLKWDWQPSQITLTDTQFVSENERFNLSNIVK